MLRFIRPAQVRTTYAMCKHGPKLSNCFSTAAVNRTEELVTVERQGAVAIVTLNNPASLNALTAPMGDQFVDVVTELTQGNGSDGQFHTITSPHSSVYSTGKYITKYGSHSTSLHVPLLLMSTWMSPRFRHLISTGLGAVVLTGAGRAFSAGGDIQFLRDRAADTPSRNAVIMRRFYERFLSVRRIPVPVVAAINGPAIGAGLCLALACDVRLAAATAPMGITFVGLGR